MKVESTPALLQACERWVQDKVLMDLLKSTSQQLLLNLGDSLDQAAMLRTQGAYKTVAELIKTIETLAEKSVAARRGPQHLRPVPSFTPNL